MAVDKKAKGAERDAGRKGASEAWRILRPMCILLISAALCAAFVYAAYSLVMERFFLPVDRNDATPIEITVPSGAGASSIAARLYKAGGVDENGELTAPGLIRSKTVFKIYVDFTGKSSKLKAGTYILSRNMGVSQIVDIICKGNPPRATVRFTTTEGMTCEEVAERLVSSGVLADKEEFLSVCRSGAGLEDNAYVAAVLERGAQGRQYVLEGYLFPDTYEVYADEDVVSIIKRMLYRFSQMMTDEYSARMAELGITVDEAMTLASLIEKEAKVSGDFARVSAVFHLRLQKGMKLQSDAPLRYIFKTDGVLDFSKEQMETDSPYNTYVVERLPVAPIANPGLAAIGAALYPDEGYMEEGYLFFCLKSGATGELIFAKTNEEHAANVAKYKPEW